MRRDGLTWLVLATVLILGGCATPSPTATPVTAVPVTVEPAEPTFTPVAPAPTAEPLAATVNRAPITLAEYERQMVNYEAAMNSAGQDAGDAAGQAFLLAARQTVLNWMIEQELIIQTAPEMGITVGEAEVDVIIQELLDDIGQTAFDERLANEGLTLAELRANLSTQLLASRVTEEVVSQVPAQTLHVNARHVLVATREEAEQLLTQIQAGADFATLARANSLDAFTREQGGDLGYFPRGVLLSSEVEEAAFRLQPGQVSEVISSELGYHILQVLDRVEDRAVSAENLRDLKDKASRHWLDELREQADIQILVDLEPSATPG
ncbi:MAG: peptidylprolyl isomerase [Chloroflexota bacterium]|nr:peptidylprolyl isomerase [Chloroflexota bacterium]